VCRAPCIPLLLSSISPPPTPRVGVFTRPRQGITDFDPEQPSRTVPIPYNASAEFVRVALEALPGVGPVEVRRSGPSDLNAYEWKITWDWGKDPVDIRGDVNNLNPDSLQLGGRWTGELQWGFFFPAVLRFLWVGWSVV
jgi:hypothetical protein